MPGFQSTLYEKFYPAAPPRSLSPLNACCGATAIAGVGLIAMPTGIVAAAFTETFARMREQNFDDE